MSATIDAAIFARAAAMFSPQAIDIYAIDAAELVAAAEMLMPPALLMSLL